MLNLNPIRERNAVSEIIYSIKETRFKSKFRDAYGTMEGFEITTDKQVIRMGISEGRQCCEHTGFFMSEDNLDEFIGAALLLVETVSDCLVPDKLSDFYEGGTMFVNFKTNRGVLQFTAYNSHNGYYSHSAVIESEQLETNEYL